MKTLITLILTAFVATLGMAQEKKINGIISDNLGNPLPGVNIIIKKTTTGTQTDLEGHYELIASVGDTLIFTYIGFKTEKVTVGTSNIINVTMKEDTAMLSEVVVTAKGIRREKKALGYAVSQLTTEQIKKRQSGDVARTLSGKASGVQITSQNGASGAATNVVIRGYSSITGNKKRSLLKIQKQLLGQLTKDASVNIQPKNGTIINSSSQPLYIVDGVAIQSQYNAVIENIDKNDIEHVNIYKVGKAKKLFGQSAKNGCIVITTKQGNYRLLNDESYAQIQENKFENVKLAPLSTFSIDVDKASYSNIRRMINNGEKVPFDAVKIEEMVNYFDYKYDQPKNEHPFSIYTEVAQTPWNKSTKLVRIGLQGKTFSNEELPASNLTFLIDVSGSMNQQNKLPLLKSAFKLLVNQLRKEDKVSIVVYAGAAGVVLEPTSGNYKEKILEALDNLQAGGSTSGGAGIELAYKLAQQNFIKKGNNRVILATDGDFNVGASSDKAMKTLIEEKRKSGVFLSVLGFGYGNYKDSKLEILADKGNGNHAYIDTMQEAQKVFGKEFGGTLYTIAKDVKIQVEFNPANVRAYRLIGYENRLLNDEDFKDDTKDAGELGSGHTVTALYEVIPVGVNSKYLNDIDDLKYTKNENLINNTDELLTVKFRYKKPDGNKSIEMVKILKNKTSNASEDLKFASAVALFGMELRKSQYINGATFNDVLELAKKGRGEDALGYRAEFIRLVSTYK